MELITDDHDRQIHYVFRTYIVAEKAKTNLPVKHFYETPEI